MSSGYRIPNAPDGTVGTCKNCRCWYYEIEEVPGGGTSLRVAECRRRSPQGIVRRDAIFGEWPRVGPDEWCGEFQP